MKTGATVPGYSGAAAEPPRGRSRPPPPRHRPAATPVARDAAGETATVRQISLTAEGGLSRMNFYLGESEPSPMILSTQIPLT